MQEENISIKHVRLNIVDASLNKINQKGQSKLMFPLKDLAFKLLWPL